MTPDGAPFDPESQALRSTLRDVASLLALPALWRGREPAHIAASLADLLAHLVRVEVAYVRLEDPTDGREVEEVRTLLGGVPAELGLRIREALAGRGRSTLSLNGIGDLHLVRTEPGVEPARWFVATGALRPQHPTENDGFLLRAAVEQAAISVENVRLYRNAQEASEAKSTFLAMMSHELRTPLNGIVGYVDLMEAGVGGAVSETQRTHLERVRAGARHLTELVEQILTFSRLQAGEEEARMEPVELGGLVRDTCALVRPLAEKKGLSFRCVAPDGPLELKSDPGRLRQILLNLLSNAIKFTEEGGLELIASADATHALLEVRDTGPGIPADQAERIFEPFQRIDHGFTRPLEGTGLGLTVTRSLAQLLGGSLALESTPGEGSTFTVRLPIAGASDRPAGAAP